MSSSVLSDFKRKVRAELDNRSNNLIRVSSPHFLYATRKQAKAYESATNGNDAYQEKLDKPLRGLIDSNMFSLTDGMEGPVHFIDLGPGYPSKSLSILDRLNEKCELTYIPVDVSPYFLDRAALTASGRGIRTHRQLSQFEDIDTILERSLHDANAKRFCFLGLTFNNFPADYISNLIAGLLDERDRCVICCQSSTERSHSELIKPYSSESVDKFCFLPLELLGFRREDFTFSPTFEDEAVRIQYVSKLKGQLEGSSFPKGTRFETSASFRYTTDRLEKILTRKLVIQQKYNVPEIGMFLYVVSGSSKHDR